MAAKGSAVHFEANKKKRSICELKDSSGRRSQDQRAVSEWWSVCGERDWIDYASQAILRESQNRSVCAQIKNIAVRCRHAFSNRHLAYKKNYAAPGDGTQCDPRRDVRQPKRL